MARGYVGNISTEKDSQGLRTWIHVDFASKKESAGFWVTRQAAKEDAGMLEHHDVAITTAEGQRHVCKGYRVEERAPGQFVIWVEAPFISPTGTDQPTVPAGYHLERFAQLQERGFDVSMTAIFFHLISLRTPI